LRTVIQMASRISGLSEDRLIRIIKFLIVGGSVNLLMILAIIGMKRLGISYDIALLITNIVGLCINYILNRSFVFGNKDGVVTTAIKYALVYLTVYFLQLIIYRLIFATGLMHEYIAIIVTIAISAVYAYILLEKVVFPRREMSEDI